VLRTAFDAPTQYFYLRSVDIRRSPSALSISPSRFISTIDFFLPMRHTYLSPQFRSSRRNPSSRSSSFCSPILAKIVSRPPSRRVSRPSIQLFPVRLVFPVMNFFSRSYGLLLPSGRIVRTPFSLTGSFLFSARKFRKDFNPSFSCFLRELFGWWLLTFPRLFVPTC